MATFDFNLSQLGYGSATVVDNCSFSLESPKVTALIGPSGCGKTTILNTLAGLIKHSHIHINTEHKISYIFQEPRLIPWLTVGDNLKLVEPDLTPSELDQILEQVKLTGNKDKFPVHLSGGMQKRVSIARAFVTQPDLVLLDEPFSSLDVPTAKHLIELVMQMLEKENAAAVLVTHDIKEALMMADDLYFLSNRPTRIIKHYKNTNKLDNKISEKADSLFNEHPDLLSGTL